MKMTKHVIPLTLISCLASCLMGQDEARSELETRVFPISHTVFSQVWKLEADEPFTGGRGMNPKEALKRHGISFPTGSTALYNPDSSQIVVRNTAGELEKIETLFDQIRILHAPRQLHIITEYIEVEAALYHNWMFENRITGDGTSLRKQTQKWLEDKKANLIETISVTARSGQRAKVDSVSEVIYPTEPGTPDIPNEVQLEGDDTQAPVVRSIPSAFETRHAGSTLEVDPVLGSDNTTIDLNLAPEIVRENGFTDWPPGEPDPMLSVSLPKFYTMKIITQVTTAHGRYAFLGTANPAESTLPKGKKSIVLLFVRSDVATILP